MAQRSNRLIVEVEAQFPEILEPDPRNPAVPAPVLPIGPRQRYRPLAATPVDQQPISRLLYGDNLDVLRKHLASESADLIYLDPPFNSKRAYNMLFQEPSGQVSPAQFQAFTDTWTWTPATDEAFDRIVQSAPLRVRQLLPALRDLLRENSLSAYLVMMTERLVELHRVLKPTGTLYLHCDPNISHYLKLVLDALFGPERYLNEVSWKRSSAHSDAAQGMRRYGRIRDVLLAYSKTKEYTWNHVYTPYDDAYVASEYRHVSDDGRYFKETDVTAAKSGGDTEYDWYVKRRTGTGVRWQPDLEHEFLNPVLGNEYKAVKPYRGRYWAYSHQNMVRFALAGKLIHRETGMPRLMQFADEMPGVPLQDLWDDISPVSGKEDLGFSTQKPLALLERIIETSSNPGDIVLDPFCGCGTAIAAAEKLHRNWIGIDITTLAIAVMQRRLRDMFEVPPRYQIEGLPVDESGAKYLRDQGRHQFEWWAVTLLGAVPHDGTFKKGADRGIDGIVTFFDFATARPKLCVVQVKSGKVSEKDIRDLLGTVTTRPGAEIGLLVTLEPPTRNMVTAARQAGIYWSEGMGKHYPRIQILTVQQILDGRIPDIPPQVPLAPAGPRIRPDVERQQPLPPWQ